MNTKETITTTPPAYRLMLLHEVLMITGLARSTIYKWMSDGCFPRAVKLNSRSVRWIENEVQEWIARKFQRRDYTVA
ncbi:AlpA family transcriptional regulator [Vibrio sp. ZF57]|uniref:helix-turn-helix transcriptional regulator n=1 Tax=Vibrio sp. ZF57 TaxID=1840084 RepID=UPI00080DC447|nr:AlpA family transcriptional regulator [Vibrio sp. ZF57]OCH53650.1 transcriptional regulator [Vibrio sp. ZF57]